MLRQEKLNSLTEKTFDVLVIGGGATGFGIAVDSITRGYSTVLLEKNDYAKSTSSRSTKVLHGGVRYLAQGNFSLVRQSLREKLINYRNAPHIARSMDFIIPCQNILQQGFYGAGMLAYDALAGFPKGYTSKMLSSSALENILPEIDSNYTNRGVVYNDGQFDDARMTISLAKTLEDHGGFPVNYIEVTDFIKENGKIIGVKAFDKHTETILEIKAKTIFNATGIYSDSIISIDEGNHEDTVTLAQGTHIVVNKDVYSSNSAMLIPKTTDGRVLFFIPWYNKVIIGTTDTKVVNVLDDPLPFNSEIDFIINNANKYLIKPINKENISSVYAGIRPLVNSKSDTSKISREEKISISNSGLISVIGGKWTTYRLMGEKIIDFAIENNKLSGSISKSKDLKLHGYLSENDLDKIPFNLKVYGSDFSNISDMKGYTNSLHPDLPINEAQVRWAIQEEDALTIDDILSRRTRSLFINARACIDIADNVAIIMQDMLGFDDIWRKQEVDKFIELAKKYLIDSYLV